MKNIVFLTPIIITLIIGVVSITLGSQYLSEQHFEAKTQAVASCMKLSTYTSTNTQTGITSVEPIENTYNKCLQLSGLK